MKNYIKYTIVFLIILLSSFILVNESENEPSNFTTTAIVKDSVVSLKKPKAIHRFASHETKAVQHKLDSLLKRINKRHDFHGSILVAKKGKLIYENQIGFADFRKKTKLKSESIFQLASVSKQFTATAIMMLKERGQLKLTDTITRYFPKFPFKNITVKQLLNHTSGLPNYFWVAEHEWNKKTPPSNNEMMTFLESNSTASMFFRPGRTFDYSNTGYFVLASIVEKISGTTFSNFLEQHILVPLQMNNTFVYSYKTDPIRKNQLIGYRLYRGWRHLKINGTVNDAIVGDKNIYATSNDLLKWVNGLNSGKLISKKSLEEMYTKGKTKYGRDVPYGYGFRIDAKNNDKIAYHFGKWNGFSTGLSHYKSDLVIIVLEHTSYQAIGTLTKKIKHLVLDNFKS